MSTQQTLADVLRTGVPFLAIMVLWIVVVAIVYGGWLLVWPDVPAANPWPHLGVYLLPVIAYLGHTFAVARGAGGRSRR